MKETLTKYGWKMFHSCHCSGVYKEYYNHLAQPGYKIIIKPKKNKFVAKNMNRTVKDANNYQLEEYLKTLL